MGWAGTLEWRWNGNSKSEQPVEAENKFSKMQLKTVENCHFLVIIRIASNEIPSEALDLDHGTFGNLD